MGGRGRKPLIAGNWKMNGLSASISVLEEIVAGAAGLGGRAELLVCPPTTLLGTFAARARGTPVAVGGQDCHAEASGAHTGDVAAAMLADLGATHVIVGHSERRQDHAETDAVVRAKAEAARAAGLIPVICVGETREERKAGRALDVVASQLRGSVPATGSPAGLIVAYEPVWAIGTGLVPTVADVAAMHAMIRRTIAGIVDRNPEDCRILYGGSVKPGNAAELLAVDHVDGALVGGASLVAADFLAIAAGVPG